MEERTTGPAFTRQEQRVNQLAAQYVELVNRGQDRNSERLTALSTQIWLGTVEAMERTLGGPSSGPGAPNRQQRAGL